MTPTKFRHAGLDWIPHTPGDPMPCDGNTLVRVLFRNHKVCSDAFVAACHDWRKMMDEWDCIGWHPIEEQPDSAETHRRAVEWHGLTDDDLRLRLGELTAQEIRTVRAVLNAIVDETTN